MTPTPTCWSAISGRVATRAIAARRLYESALGDAGAVPEVVAQSQATARGPASVAGSDIVHEASARTREPQRTETQAGVSRWTARGRRARPSCDARPPAFREMRRDLVALRDGARIVVRPIEPADRALLREGFDKLSPESRYRRFFRPVNALSDRQLDELVDVDHRDREALVALNEHMTEIIGVARYSRTSATTAEPAVVVIDHWQGRGVGTVVLDRLVDRALDEGVERFAGVALASNPTAIRLIEQAGDVTIEPQGTLIEFDIELRPRATAAEATSPLRMLLRAVAVGTLEPAVTFWERFLPPLGDEPNTRERE